LSRSSYPSSKKYRKPLKTPKKGLLEGVWVGLVLCFFKKKPRGSATNPHTAQAVKGGGGGRDSVKAANKKNGAATLQPQI
jgi:hypothetical protein